MSDTVFCGTPTGARPLLDRLDPRSRVGAAFAVVASVLVISSPTVLAAIAAAAAVAGLASGLDARALGRRLLHVEGFLVVLVVAMPLTAPGPAAFTLAGLAISQPGLDRAVLVVLRVTAAALTVLTLLAGLEPVRLGHALARLGMPEKLVLLLLFTARWVALVREEAGRLHEALRARAFRATTSRHGLATLAHFVGQLLVRAFERAERVEEAMRCRAFSGRFAVVAEDRFGRIDAIFATALGLALLFTFVGERFA
ncbi:MAG: cobalt ECF transporter T component CbiQ [Phyllobacteriaceae bacterium]|nr:cobalt ECF transporter T component CbiQ [Phyllobacteriaceae bacterium]